MQDKLSPQCSVRTNRVFSIRRRPSARTVRRTGGADGQRCLIKNIRLDHDQLLYFFPSTGIEFAFEYFQDRMLPSEIEGEREG